jgi:hypothetical protein
MPVSEEEVKQLERVRFVLENEVKRGGNENDVKGIYDRVLEFLTGRANGGEDIAVARGYTGRSPCNLIDREENRKRFHFEVVRGVLFNEFSRYLLYELHLGDLMTADKLARKVSNVETCMDVEERVLSTLKEKIKGYAYGKDWYFALNKVAKEVTYHWGTRLEARK